MHVRFAAAEVAALDGVVEQPVDRVAVALVVLRGVDAALRGDRVSATRRVVERERLDLVAEFAERGRSRRAGQPGADDDDLELALVRRVHQLLAGDVVVPLVGHRAVGNLGIEVRVSFCVLSQFDGDGIGVVLDHTGERGDRERQVSGDDQRGRADGGVASPCVELRVVPTHRLEQ